MLRKAASLWRLCAKLLSYFSFGVCSFLFSSVGFPILFALSGFSKKRFRFLARKVLYRYFRFFVLEMRMLGLLTLNVKGETDLSKVKSTVVIANHPSFLDVVILFSLIPDANCIVKGSLEKTPFVRKFVRYIYVSNSIPFSSQEELVSQSIREGCSLIIFPEGTRTTPGKPLEFKKGAARFALHARCDVLPIHIGGNEKIGFRKNDSVFSVHPTERYHYDITVLSKISTRDFLNLPGPAAVIRLTEEMQKVLENA